jgi:hypothetical protein
MYASLPLVVEIYMAYWRVLLYNATIKHLGEYSHGKQSNASTATNKVQFQQLWL